jgi:NAD(P)-dependent dehydrogenase (short-subunit alcohol dehydrogenase family)
MAILRSDGRAWRDRVVVVTGGTSGIGREFAVRLTGEGATVIACARHEVALRELDTRYPQIEAIRCDVTVPLDVLALEAAIQDRYGRVDVLINNAGIREQVDLLDQSVSDDLAAASRDGDRRPLDLTAAYAVRGVPTEPACISLWCEGWSFPLDRGGAGVHRMRGGLQGRRLHAIGGTGA